MSGRAIVLRGDAAHLPLPDASIHAVVCDPPYALTELPVAKIAEALSAWLDGDRGYVPKTGAGGFMGRKWDDFVPPPAAWDECMRVLKPGGHVLAFAAPRTQDLMGMSIRLAGFEIREGIKWITGSGFPKSLDVSKAIDKRPGVSLHREFAAHLASRREQAGLSRADVSERVTGTRTGACWNWEHHQFPEARWWPLLRDLLDLDVRWEAIVAEADREVVGQRTTGIGTGRGSVTVIADGENRDVTAPATEDAARWEGWGTALKPAHEPIIVARKPMTGTVAANVLAYGTGALNVAGCRVSSEGSASDVIGRWPPNVLLSDEAAAEMDRQSGASISRIGQPRASARPGDGYGMTHTGTEYADEGGASRFFPVFRYEAKADASERPRLPDGTAWPTVKPVALMRWLVRLVTPPGGIVGDFFCGTGPTGEAAIIEGFDAILLDKDPQAIALTRVRLAKPIQPLMFAPEPAAGQPQPEHAASAQDSLFDLGESA